MYSVAYGKRKLWELRKVLRVEMGYISVSYGMKRLWEICILLCTGLDYGGYVEGCVWNMIMGDVKSVVCRIRRLWEMCGVLRME